MRYNPVKFSVLQSLKMLSSIRNILALLVLFGISSILSVGQPLNPAAFTVHKSVKLKPSSDIHELSEEVSFSPQLNPLENSEDDYHFTASTRIEAKTVVPFISAIDTNSAIFIAPDYLIAPQRAPPVLS